MRLERFVSHFRQHMVLAVPVMLGHIGQMLVAISDTAMVGLFLGPDELAAATFTMGAFMLVLMFSLGFSFGITPLVGNAFGKGDKARTAVVFKNGMAVNLAVSLLTVLALLVMYGQLHRFGQEPEVVRLAGPYLLIITASVPFGAMFLGYKQYAEGLSSTKPAMYLTLANNLLNVVLNYWFIKGGFGLSAMGLNGVAYATLLSRVAALVSIAIYMHSTPFFSQYIGKGWREPFGWKDALSVSKVGAPVGMQFFMEGGAFSMAAILMGWVGKYEQGAHQVALNVAALSFMVYIGISAACTIRVSSLSAKGKYREMNEVVITASVICILYAVCAGSAMVFFREQIPYLFINMDEPGAEQVVFFATQLVMVAALFQFVDGLQAILHGSLRGLEDVNYPTFFSFLAFWVVALPLGQGLMYFMEDRHLAIWVGLATGLSLICFMLLLRYRHIYRRLRTQTLGKKRLPEPQALEATA